jgi:RNA polymerase sigma-70 factor (ECF subfamily)
VEHSEQHEQFVRLLTRHDRELRRYACVLLADPAAVDDVMQESSVALWRKCEEYDAAQPFVPWACRFVYYEVLKYRKQQQTRRRFFSDAAVEALAEECVPRPDEYDAQRRALQDCLTLLPAADRELIGLRYATNASIATLARETGQPAKALYRALERIRRALTECVGSKLAAEG